MGRGGGVLRGGTLPPPLYLPCYILSGGQKLDELDENILFLQKEPRLPLPIRKLFQPRRIDCTESTGGTV